MKVELKVIVTVLLLYLAVIAYKDVDNEPDSVKGSRDCRKYSALGQAVHCMGSQYSNGNVTKTQMKYYLLRALD